MILLVGQAPGPSGGAPFAGRSGAFLARLSGLSQQEFLRRTGPRNLLRRWPGPSGRGKGDAFPARRARRAADRIRRSCRGWTSLILAGRAVAGAFGLGGLPLLRWSYDPDSRLRVAVVPHPSGINRWWNAPANRRRAARFLRDALRRPWGP